MPKASVALESSFGLSVFLNFVYNIIPCKCAYFSLHHNIAQAYYLNKQDSLVFKQNECTAEWYTMTISARFPDKLEKNPHNKNRPFTKKSDDIA